MGQGNRQNTSVTAVEKSKACADGAKSRQSGEERCAETRWNSGERCDLLEQAFCQLPEVKGDPADTPSFRQT